MICLPRFGGTRGNYYGESKSIEIFKADENSFRQLIGGESCVKSEQKITGFFDLEIMLLVVALMKSSKSDRGLWLHYCR